MPKLAWVALPLLAALGLWVALAWRGRPLSRHHLNVVSSLLLLAYLATTAGLGIFWVANQQLPVFDWHYLFGYVTLALVVLHLVFNFRIVWRTLVRPRPRPGSAPPPMPPQERPPAVPARRRWLSLIAVALPAGGGGFLLGVRQGRLEGGRDRTAPAEPASSARTEGPVSPADALAEVERFHALSSHARGGVLLRAPSVDWGFAPPPFKDEDGPRLALPAPRPAPGLATVSTLLWHTAGITQRRGGLALRASPASGALFSTELYLASRGESGVPPGLWHHDARTDTLVRIGDMPSDDEALGAPPGATEGATVRVLVTAVFRRTGHKYRDRAYRYLWADLGHALENLRQAAGACALQATLLPAFDGLRAEAALGLVPGEEGVLAWVVMRPTVDARVLPRQGGWVPVPAPEQPTLGVTHLAHARTSLRRSASPHPLAASVPLARDEPRPAFIPLPAVRPVERDTLSLIARRRSQRRFSARALPLQTLATLLAGLQPHAARTLLSTAVRINLVAHAVDGLAPGAYRVLPDGHGLVRTRGTGGLRHLARAAALDQDVIGDGAAVLVLSADRAMLAADPLGPLRGYRHAFIEAGLVGERIYLEAGASGLGACAVGAFYDDEAAALVGADLAREWPLHFAAVGWPA